MILKKEIETNAESNGVAKSTIDKDWVLGHFIDAIFSFSGWRNQLIFKGGTCLRKCYFSTYRFSEDLDFTSINKEFELTKINLSEIIQIITDAQIRVYDHKIKLRVVYRKFNFCNVIFFVV